MTFRKQCIIFEILAIKTIILKVVIIVTNEMDYDEPKLEMDSIFQIRWLIVENIFK